MSRSANRDVSRDRHKRVTSQSVAVQQPSAPDAIPPLTQQHDSQIFRAQLVVRLVQTAHTHTHTCR